MKKADIIKEIKDLRCVLSKGKNLAQQFKIGYKKDLLKAEAKLEGYNLAEEKFDVFIKKLKDLNFDDCENIILGKIDTLYEQEIKQLEESK